MAVKKKAASRLPATDLIGSDPDDLTPQQSVAREILAERGDLLPSVERISDAGLDDDAVVVALTLFQTALENPGDPNRDPRVAIANASGAEEASS